MIANVERYLHEVSEMDYASCAKEMLQLFAEARWTEAGRAVHQGMSGEAAVLYDLREHEGQAHPRELSQRLGVSTARVAAILGHLEEAGLITRQRQSDDKRQILVELTETGARSLEEYIARMQERFRLMFEAFGEEDTLAYIRLQRKMMAYFQQRHS